MGVFTLVGVEPESLEFFLIETSRKNSIKIKYSVERYHFMHINIFGKDEPLLVLSRFLNVYEPFVNNIYEKWVKIFLK